MSLSGTGRAAEPVRVQRAGTGEKGSRKETWPTHRAPATRLLPPASSLAAPGGDCPEPGELYGKIEVVESFADCRVEVVGSFADLHVQTVESFADSPGEWQMVARLLKLSKNIQKTFKTKRNIFKKKNMQQLMVACLLSQSQAPST